ncbi:MAG: FtsW/RodA/SpoVE family cell cycle protein [Bacteroidales bacterium]|jgi:cell division protein FtsW
MSKFKIKLQGDKVIWGLVIILSVISLLAVYSSTGLLAFIEKGGDTEYYFQKHFVIVILGLIFMFVAHKVNYPFYANIARWAIFIAIPLLIYTLVSGDVVNSAARWNRIPILGITFQTSDLAKLALIMFVAYVLTVKQNELSNFKSGLSLVLIISVIVSLLVAYSNLSTGVIIFAICFCMMFYAGARMKHILLISGAGIFIFLILISSLLIMHKFESRNTSKELAQTVDVNTKQSRLKQTNRASTWQGRIVNFFTGEEDKDSDANYQSRHSKIAIANGGITGKMPGNSSQKTFLPNSHSDFIYAIIVEEYGLIGGIVVLLIYVIFFFRGISISINAPGTFGALLAFGITISITIQAFVNILVAVGLFPVTGQNLPLISMGGSSNWFTSISIGMLLSISAFDDREKELKTLKTDN